VKTKPEKRAILLSQKNLPLLILGYMIKIRDNPEYIVRIKV
jgi:hypothetical protein